MLLSRSLLVLACCLILLPGALAQRASWRSPRLASERTKTGDQMLDAFSVVARSARDSVVSFEVDGEKAALGAIVGADGWIVTKASEVRVGKLTCTLSNGLKLDAELVAVDDDNDLALVRIEADGLTPVEWAKQETSVGRWVTTPGIGPRPEAVGVVSAPQRRILRKRAIIGVLPDFSADSAQIREVIAGLGAAKAGMKSGDVILAVNNVPVGNGEELVSTLGEFREGQVVQLRIRRDGEELELSVPMSVPEAESLGRGFARQERMNRMGSELSRRADGFQLATQHDSFLQPWQCGGPLVNLDGKAIGLNIARAGRIASYALPATLVEEIVERLKKQAAN